MVPESGRFTVSFARLTCVAPAAGPHLRPAIASRPATVSPLDGETVGGADPVLRRLIVDLGLVWADFERMLRETRSSGASKRAGRPWKTTGCSCATCASRS